MEDVGNGILICIFIEGEGFCDFIVLRVEKKFCRVFLRLLLKFCFMVVVWFLLLNWEKSKIWILE